MAQPSTRGTSLAGAPAAVAPLTRQAAGPRPGQAAATAAARPSVTKRKKGGKVKAKDLAIFTRQFSVMISAGLPLVQALEILGSQQESKVFGDTLNGIRSLVEGGTALSAALRQYPKAFDELYSNMVEAAETGGILEGVLQRLSQYIEKAVKLKRAVRSGDVKLLV